MDLKWGLKEKRGGSNWMQWYLSHDDDASVNEALRNYSIYDVFRWLDYYGKKRSNLVWEIFGKEVKCQYWKEGGKNFDKWWVDGREIATTEFWEYFREWLLEQILEAGIVVSS
jgi:hypothetical protein